MTEERFTALILAAGLSSRMGEFKPLLPLGGTTVIGQAIESFRNAGIEDILVVAGFAAERLIPVLQEHQVEWVINHEYEQGMFSSLRAGVRKLRDSCEAFFVLPADHPFVRPATIIALMKAFRLCDEKKLVFRPSYRGQRGHPPLVSSALLPDVLGFDEKGGLRKLLARYDEKTLNVVCDDPGILIDIDSQKDYRTAVEQYEDSNCQPVFD